MSYLDHNIFNENFEDIEQMFDYKPFFGDSIEIIEDIIKNNNFIKENGYEKGIYDAYKFAKKAHGDQKRLSGEEYIVHPVKALEILLFLRPDLPTIQACILHDVIEDTKYEYEDILKTFGQEVAELCLGLTKVSRIKYHNRDEKQLEAIKKTFLAMAKDLRVIFIKLADRIHNIQTLEFHPDPNKRAKIAIETIKMYVPVAKRLGLFRYAIYLENGSFRILENKKYNEIIKFVKKRFRNADKYIDQGIKKLTDLLESEGIKDFEIKSRVKSPYRIYEKINNKYDNDIGKVFDILAFRIITDSLSDCYSVLGLIHSQRRPIIHKIKDYIAVPKFNNYQSLHTTILGMFHFPLEIQIRTKKMDEVAEYGVAAHFGYSENKGSIILNKKQAKWIKELQEIVSSYTSFESEEQKNSFKENLNMEFLNRNTFIYTPIGDILELPENSTVLDFAFRVHSDVGLKFKNAIVNGNIKPITFVPKTGDMIDIKTFRNKYSATKYRFEFLRTPSAKSKLAKFLKQKNKDEYIKEGIEIVNHKLKEYKLPNLYNEGNLITKTLSEAEIEKELIQIIDKQTTAFIFIKSFYKSHIEALEKTEKQKTITKDKEIVPKNLNKIIIDDDKNMEHRICPLCNPKVGQKIIAKTGKEGLKIHKMNCVGIKTVSFNKLFEAHRKGEKNNIYFLSVILDIEDNGGGLVSIMSILSQMHIDIENITVEKKQNKVFTIKIGFNYKNPSRFGSILTNINKYPFIKIIKQEIC